MAGHNVLWLTERSEYHQRRALEAAPETLDVKILREPSQEELQHHLLRAEILISERRGRIDDAFLQLAPSLKLIIRIGALIDDIDLRAIQVAGIRLVQQPDLGTIMVAEHCMMMVLALLKKLNASQAIAQSPAPMQKSRRTDENTFSYNWSSMGGVQGLYGKVVAIVGMGEIGLEIARRLQVFHPAEIRYFKRSQYSRVVEREFGLTYHRSIEEALSGAMVAIALLPYSPNTDMTIGSREFGLLPRGAVFIHAGSGATIDENAVIDVLNIGHLGGAALDTFEYEPLPSTSPLIELSKDPVVNLILTPHIAGATLTREQTARVLVYQVITRFLAGDPLHQEVRLS